MPFTTHELLIFSLACLLLVLTPGPNMIYCVSRSITQGARAGMLSLVGVVLGIVVHLTAAIAGLSALLAAMPMAFEVLRIAGASYLLWLAWQAVKPGGAAPFEVRDLPQLRWRLLGENCQLIENQALPGYLRFYVKDPAGNQLEFIEPEELHSEHA